MLRRGSLWAIDAQIAGNFVDFILHQIEGSDLDVGIEYFRRLRANLQAMPRMRTELTDLDEFFVFAGGLVECALFHDRDSLDLEVLHRPSRAVKLLRQQIECPFATISQSR